MKADGRIDLRSLAGLPHRAPLRAVSPWAPEHELVASAAGGERVKERNTLVRQHDVARLARLRQPDKQRSQIRIEIADEQARELLIATARQQRGLDELPEIRVGGIYQPLGVRDRETLLPSGRGLREGLDARPCLVARDLFLAQRVIERGLYIVKSRFALALRS